MIPLISFVIGFFITISCVTEKPPYFFNALNIKPQTFLDYFVSFLVWLFFSFGVWKTIEIVVWVFI